MNRFILAALTIMLLVPQTVQAEAFTAEQKAEINKMMEEYLLNSGENILKAVNDFQEKQAIQEREEASKNAATFIKEIEDKGSLPMIGNSKGGVTIVEFFDYNCGYCRQALNEINKLLDVDNNLKVVLMDMPILGPSSVEAAKWALAAHKQDKYFEFHQDILNLNGPKDENAFEKIAKDHKLDIDKLKKDKESKEVQEVIDQNLASAAKVGIRGTPGFIIGGEIYPGFMPYDQMVKIIEEKRKK